MPVQNPGVTSLFALHNLHKTERAMGVSIERLSSGKRINHAGDDAAGGAIADRMTAQIKGLNMSVRNASDVLSMAQVAEGALDESSKVLQRIRELAIQSASDLMNGEERLYLQTEANQLIAELDRVARDTTFNEIAVLDGTFADRRFQIGSKEREAATVSIGNLRTEKIGNHIVRTSATAGEANLATAALRGTTDTVADEDFTIHGLLGSKTIDVVANASAKDIAEAVNIAFDSTGVSATASTNLKIQGLATSGNEGSATLSIGIQGKNTTARTISAGVTLGTAVGTSDLTNLSNSINAYSAETGVVAVLSADKATVYLTQDEGHDIILTDLDFADVGDAETHKLEVTGMDSRLFDSDGTTELLSGSAVNVFDKAFTNSSAQSAGYADSVIVSGQVNMHASHSFTVTTDYGTGSDGLFESSPGVATLNKVSELSLRSRSKAIDALKMVDKALDKIHMERAKLGAVMSRMDQAIDNLTNVSANTASARSRIMDADMAAEAGNLTKTQILQQSAMAMIAQASKAQQAVLTLLQG
ncbi:MAG: flagellin [Alphaproteobacteria bacterium]|nr:MAG: flagellin [Alphaproteobacteria bacterium]